MDRIPLRPVGTEFEVETPHDTIDNDDAPAPRRVRWRVKAHVVVGDTLGGEPYLAEELELC